MAQITLGSEPVQTVGTLPETGATLPAFTLVGNDLAEVDSASFAGKKIVLNIFPSLDTDVCSASVRRFNTIAEELDDTVIVCVSKDLPFAQGRFCGAEGIKNVVVASAFRSSFGEDYGVTMADGALKGLLSRAIVVADSDGKVAYTQQVPEIHDEPDYDAARAAVVSLD
ncbi:thiol peroxidase [Bifidobacterium sp.]|jgi:thiol peroxidase|uniref:thiol peroxidase n=1 Tax=Bifidobacterium sp. TaxID=41200 RepID=UPI0025C14523|nr:thiol peroxidase [Bifidobacterium sp.]MCH4208952.1 thiol peroxidase [Bifidobacterium sp.]MCI1225518.1 thiol peroxidase [Bifidobacterium sp.]